MVKGHYSPSYSYSYSKGSYVRTTMLYNLTNVMRQDSHSHKLLVELSKAV